MGGPDATPNLWKQLFSAVRASGGYPGNGVRCGSSLAPSRCRRRVDQMGATKIVIDFAGGEKFLSILSLNKLNFFLLHLFQECPQVWVWHGHYSFYLHGDLPSRSICFCHWTIRHEQIVWVRIVLWLNGRNMLLHALRVLSCMVDAWANSQWSTQFYLKCTQLYR